MENQDLKNLQQKAPSEIKKDKKIGNIDEEDSSEWSLDSLEDIKAINIHQLLEEQNNIQSHHKEKQPLQVKFPDKPNVLPNAPLHEIGKIIYVVGQLLIVQANFSTFVVDLDNWICNENRELLGFVMDVLGKIQSPFYAVRLENTQKLSQFIGKSIYYIEGSSKILKDDDIKSMQSKSALQAQQIIEDSSEEQIQVQKKERKYSVQRQDRRRSPPWKRQRKFRQQPQHRHQSRDRTRQNKAHNRNPSRQRNDHNQRYLQSMYSMHYDQMMRLYNGNIQQNPINNNVQPNQMQNPFFNPQTGPIPPFPHQNIAQFGSINAPQQFYGQTFQTNPPIFQGQPGIFNPQQTGQQHTGQQYPNQQQPGQQNQGFNNESLFGNRQGQK